MRVVVEKDVVVPMRDGVQLVADVYLPDERGPFPTLIQRVPYNRQVGRIVDFSIDVQRVVRNGYAVLVQDVRGRFASGGAFRPFVDDSSDGVDTIAWTANQPWSNGRVGAVGGSYGGWVQWAAARERPDPLRAIAPFVASGDTYDGWIYRNGVFELGFNLHWALRNIAPPVAAAAGPDRLTRTIHAGDRISELYSRTPLRDQPELQDVAPFYTEWLDEPTPSGRITALQTPTGSVTAPTLSIGGWYDVFQRGTIAGHTTMVAPGTPRRLVIGPWAHSVFGGMFPERSFGALGDAAVADLTAEHLRWYDRFVKGDGSSSGRDPEARIFVMGADYWRDEEHWPPADTVEQALFIHPNGHLAARPSRDRAQDTYRYDPNDPVPTVGGATFLPGLHLALNSGPRDQRVIEARKDVLVYSTERLETPCEVAGNVRVVVYISSSAPDTDLVATLTDVHPDGRSLHVTDGIVRLRYRDSRAAPALLIPGKTYEIEIDLGNTAYVFNTRHRIRLLITSGSFPRYERNPQTGGLAADESRLDAALNTISFGSDAPSCLKLPTVEREQTKERLT